MQGSTNFERTKVKSYGQARAAFKANKRETFKDTAAGRERTAQRKAARLLKANA